MVENGHEDDAPTNGREVQPRADAEADIELYRDLVPPEPVEADPPPAARWLAFASILLGGLLGGLIGYGTIEVLYDSAVLSALGGLVAAALGAVGVGIVAGLTLRAMNEWNAVEHPERERRP